MVIFRVFDGLTARLGPRLKLSLNPHPLKGAKGGPPSERKAKTRTFPKAKGCAAQEWNAAASDAGLKPSVYMTSRLTLRGGVWSNADHLRAMRLACGTRLVFFVFEGGADEGCE